MARGGASDQDREAINEQADSDRRIATRHLACFPAHIDDGATRKRTAMIHDLSVTGAKLLTRAKVAVGDPISLTLYLTPDLNAPCVTTGRVVRFEKREPEFAEVWPHSIAIQFEQPLLAYEKVIKEIAEHQKGLGLRTF